MLAVPPTPRDRDIPVDRCARPEGTSPLNSGHEKMARDNRSDLARLERMERRLQALEDAEAIRNLKARYAALCDKQYDADGIAMLFTEDALWESPGLGRFEGREAIRGLFREASELLPRDPLQLEWPYRGGRRYGASAVVPVHALHRYRRQSGDVARQHRSR